jgi:RNA 3'-terminal phosphate cyclase (ATP)
MVHIDGREGEGGGQVLRTALALSACLERPFVITNIRANRTQPGLKAQHLAAVAAVARICQAKVEGAALGSRELHFTPGPLTPGEYEAAVGTAGATTLVAQAALLPLLHAPGPSRLRMSGGTHVAWSPPFEHTAGCLLPLLSMLGYSARAGLGRHGFYPRGGGRIEVATRGGGPAAPPARLVLQRPARAQICVRATALVCALPRTIAERMLMVATRLLAERGWACEERVVERSGPTGSVGTYLFIHVFHAADLAATGAPAAERPAVEGGWIAGGFTGLGERGKPAERVAREAAAEALSFLESDASLDARLADQILVPAALAGVELDFRTERISNHLRTNAATLAHFLESRVEADAAGRVRVS